MLDKLEIAKALREIAGLMQIKGENPYKARAYENGADAVEGLDEEIGVLVDEKRLTSFRGIGSALAAVIADLYLTGRSEVLDKLREELPPGVLELANVPGLTVKRIQALHNALGISSIEELKTACLTGNVRKIKGFGEKTEATILQGIHKYQTRDERILLVDALDIAEPLLDHIRSCEATERAELAGSIRRWNETVRGIHIVAATKDSEAIFGCLDKFPRFSALEAKDEARAAIRLTGGVMGEIVCVPPAEFAGAMVYKTGSRAHVEKLRSLAEKQGFTLDDRGLVNGSKRLALKTEEALYNTLGLALVPPELREADGEIEAALEAGAEGSFAEDLIELGDIQGMVHCHTVFSDGKGTIEEMALGAEAMGMKYLTITDHSPAAHYANGVALDRLKKQWDEIARVQEKVKTLRLLRGTESDILESGALDYPDAVLEKFDVIIASIHSRMKMDEAQMTRRLVTAMKQPVFKIWGHALGRLIQRRDPFACRVEEVLDAIAESRAAIEVNGDPYRLDMQPKWIKEARKRGIRFVISTDAHSVGAMHNLKFGVGTARRGGLRKSEVLNALGPEAFRKAVQPAA